MSEVQIVLGAQRVWGYSLVSIFRTHVELIFRIYAR